MRYPAATFEKVPEKGGKEFLDVPPDGGMDEQPEKISLDQEKQASQLVVEGIRKLWEHDRLYLYPASAGLPLEA